MLVRDVMTSPAITAGPKTGLMEIIHLLLDNRISAIPIVDKKSRLLGLVSEGDLVRRAEIGTDHRRSWWLSVFRSAAVLADEYLKTHGVKAEQFMTTHVVTVREDTPILEVADIMEGRRFKRLPVLRGEAVVGIVSRADLLRALVVQRETPVTPPSPEDSVIRDELLRSLEEESWADLAHIKVLVKDCIVHIWGSVRSEEQRDAIEVAASNIHGVREVVNRAHVSLTLL